VGWNWVHLVRRPLTGLLYQPRTIDDECGEVGGMIIGRGSTTLSTTNPTWPDVGLKPSTNRLSYGTALFSHNYSVPHVIQLRIICFPVCNLESMFSCKSMDGGRLRTTRRSFVIDVLHRLLLDQMKESQAGGTCMGKTRVIRKSERKRPLWKPRHRHNDVKMALKEI
jgi:hypothetical protein